tara:strand:+ start:15847 stop:16749 length:903 start_codon:yes stop_codon:yes gene_type:complete
LNIAIIGYNSFIAKNLLKFLQTENHTIHLFGRSKKKDTSNLIFHKFNYPANKLDINILTKFNIIIYFAGAGIQSNLNENADLIFYLNYELPKKIFLSLSENEFKGKILTFGSYFQIGFNDHNKFFSEDEIANSNNLVPNDYCRSKRLLTTFLKKNKFNFSFYHLILSNVYGFGENNNRLIPYVINSIKSKSPLVFTSGDQIRQYIHVNDIGKLILKIIKYKFEGGIYNITNKKSVLIKDLIYKIFDLCNENIDSYNISFGKAKRKDSGMKILLLDNHKSVKNLRFEENISLDSGILDYLK